MAAATLSGRVLITGASGFIGNRLRSELISAGADVVALRRSGSPPAEVGRSVQADYSELASLERVIRAEKPDYVLHLAGVTKGASYADFRRGNVMPTRNLLAAVRREHPNTRRFVFASSSASYGPSASLAPQREENPPRPIEHYGRSKLEAERVVQEESAEVPWTIVRPCAVYGPGDVDHFPLFQAAVLGFNLFYGNRDRRVSWIYVDDCVRGIIEAASSPKSVDSGYFLTHETPHTWEEFQAEIVRAVGGSIRSVDLPEGLLWLSAFAGEIATRIDGKPRLLNLQKARLGAQRAWICSGDSARKDFGFVAETDLMEGTRLTHEWYSENDWYQSRSPRELLSLRSLRRLVGHFRRTR